MKEQNDKQKKHFRRRFKIAAVILIVISIAFIFCFPLILKSMYPSTSEMIIRKAAAAQLHKDPNELTKEDFAKIEMLHFENKTELSDIKFLKKFVNLKELSLNFLQDNNGFYDVWFFQNQMPIKTPKWKAILAKLGIIKILKQRGTEAIDLKPLEKLTNIEKLDLSSKQIINVDSLACLKNLKELNLSSTNISDLKAIKKLTNLWQLYLMDCKNITENQIQDLQKALPDLKINYITYTPPWTKRSSNDNGIEK